jgi:hypothetical protein
LKSHSVDIINRNGGGIHGNANSYRALLDAGEGQITNNSRNTEAFAAFVISRWEK